MSFQNLTPFPAISWENVNAKKQWHITTLVRVKYRFHPSSSKKGQWQLLIHQDQEDLFGEDIFFEDNINLPVRYESDFVIYKPNTDIILNAKAKDARGLAIKNQCTFVITDPNKNKIKDKTINVYGKYPWLDGSSNKKNYSMGTGFVGRGHNDRLRHAGTYDKSWIKHQHPYPPHDYSHAYNQAAHSGLIMSGFIKPGSKIGLSNLLSEGRDVFTIPKLNCFVEHVSPSKNTHRYVMNIDTVLIDIDSDKQEDWAVYLSYRYYQIKTYEPKDTIVKYLPTPHQLEVQHG